MQRSLTMTNDILQLYTNPSIHRVSFLEYCRVLVFLAFGVVAALLTFFLYSIQCCAIYVYLRSTLPDGGLLVFMKPGCSAHTLPCAAHHIGFFIKLYFVLLGWLACGSETFPCVRGFAHKCRVVIILHIHKLRL
jgi:hypothetical protein